MPKCVFERATGIFTAGTNYDDVPHDPATHVQVELAAYPDRRTQRWNGDAGLRAATAQEMAAFDLAEKNALADNQLDDIQLLKAIVLWQAQLHGLTMAQARDQIRTIYRSLS